MIKTMLKWGGLSGGYWALFRFELQACYHINLGIFWGVWLFQKFFLSKIKPYPGWITFRKYNGKSFFYFFKYWPKRSKKKFRTEIWTFSLQICFKNQFSTSGSGQTENRRVREYVYFQFDHFPKLKIDF